MADCVAEQLESIYLRRSIAIVLRIIPYLASEDFQVLAITTMVSSFVAE